MIKAIVVVCAGAFVLSADTGTVSVALPTIQTELRISGGDLSWVNNAFTLPLAAFLIMFGRLGDLLGQRRMFIAGCLLAGGSALVCGLAGSSGVLFAFRALQGLGGAMLLANGLGIILAITRTPEDRALGMALWGMSNATAIASGFVVGGLVTDQISWNWIFIGNLPVLLAIAGAAYLLIPALRPRGERRNLDVAGSVLSATGLGLGLLGVVKSIDWGWGDTRTLVLLAASLVILGLFVLVELKSRDPLIPHKTFRIRNVSGGHLAVLFGTGASAGVVLCVLYLQPVLGFSATETGLLLLPEATAGAVGSVIAAQSVRRFGSKFVVPIGLVIAAGSMLWLSERLEPDGNYWTVAVPLLFLGLGIGWSVVSATMTAAEAFAEEDSAVSSGTINSFSHVGASVLIAISFTTMFAYFYSRVPQFVLDVQEAQQEAGVQAEGSMPLFVAIPWVEGEVRALRVGAIIILASAIVLVGWLTNRAEQVADQTVEPTEEEFAKAAMPGG